MINQFILKNLDVLTTKNRQFSIFFVFLVNFNGYLTVFNNNYTTFG